MDTLATPVSPAERIEVLDAIRGFALLGIFIMNMPTFNTSFFAWTDGTPPWPEWWDRAAETGRDVLFSGKFNSMFSMLFAIGFTIQLERLLERQPARAVAIYLRRLFWLFVFGLVHACVFWTGDILHMYALLGVLLLLLRRISDRVIVGLIVLCLLYPAVLGMVRLAMTTPEDVEYITSLAHRWEAADNAIYGDGSFLQVVRRNVETMVLIYSDSHLSWSMISGYVQIVTTMLIGLLLGRRRFFQNIAANLRLARRVQWWALAIGIVCGVIFGTWEAMTDNPVQPTAWKIVSSMCYAICRIAIMIFYVAVIIRAMHNEQWRRRLSPVTLAGRMPLTNYLMQTLIATILFYGYGFGLWGKVGPALDLVLAVFIFFAIQVPLTKVWLGRFQLGPMEYLWRRLTYGRAALRGTAAPAPAGAIE